MNMVNLDAMSTDGCFFHKNPTIDMAMAMTTKLNTHNNRKIRKHNLQPSSIDLDNKLPLSVTKREKVPEVYQQHLRRNDSHVINLESEVEADEYVDVRSEAYCNLKNARRGSIDYRARSVSTVIASANGGSENVRSKMTNLEGIKELLAYKRHRFHSMNSFESIVSLNSKSKRLVEKDGFVDIKYSNIPGMNSKYLKDIFHTMMDLKWRYIVGLFIVSFILTWIIFGTIWYAIVLYRPHKNCLENVDSWTTAFLFSIETQTTIGYGGRAVTPNCVEGVFLLLIQTIVGMLVNCATLGILFAKLARPKNRGKTTMFSKRAVVTVRDGNLCLMFRYVDLRHRRLLDTNMRAVIVRPKLTEEGEFIPIDMADLKLTIDFQQEEYALRLFPLFPITIIHVIDDKSPLYTMSKSQLELAEFEIIPILEGTVPTTGSSAQILTSYRPAEILWGHRFKPVFTGMHIGHKMNRIDLSTLHDTYKDSHTLPISAEIYYRTKCAEADEKDCSSTVSESHGYESGPLSSYSTSCPYNKQYLDLESGSNLCLDLHKDLMQCIPFMKESSA